MEEFKSRIENKNGHIVLNDLTGNMKIMADRYHFTGIMINLVDNALKYTGRPPEINIQAAESKDRINIIVSDNGEGIEKKFLKRVFMPFFRVPSGNVHNVKGSGLGLSYVRKICDLHRWKVWINSEPGKGTIVTISLPKLS